MELQMGIRSRVQQAIEAVIRLLTPVPEIRGLIGAEVHTPWALLLAVYGAAGCRSLPASLAGML